jgi:hypothetical protein
MSEIRMMRIGKRRIKKKRLEQRIGTVGASEMQFPAAVVAAAADVQSN